jgi:hypothetical protein
MAIQGYGIRNVDGVEHLFYWEEDLVNVDMEWDDDIAQDVRDAAMAKIEVPE